MLKIRAKRAGPGVLKNFIDEIKSVTVGAEWIFSVEDVLSHFNISHEDFYKYLYANKEFSVDGFSHLNTDLLVNFLTECGITDVHKKFSEAGYFFDKDQLIEFQEIFQSVTLSRLQNLEIDRDLLETSLAGCSKTEDGLTFYIDAVSDIKEFIDFASGIYLERNSYANHSVSRSILNNYIIKQISIGGLKLEDLRSAFRDTLYRKAVLWNLISPESRKLPAGVSLEVRNALKILDFSENHLPDEKSLKMRYRELVKKFHPDINPDGLVITSKINTAYELVMNSFKPGSSEKNGARERKR